VKPTNNHSTTAHREEHLLAPYWAEIKEIVPEAEGVSTYWLEFTDKEIRKKYQFACGQFNMLYLPGYGEAAISISSDPENPGLIGHTVRFVGNVTQAISRLNVGETMGIRGPFGTTWPIDELKGQDVVIAAGGIGLAPLRPVIYHIINHRDDYGRVVVIYGARSPRDLLYPQEFATWEDKGIDVMPTVDTADESWQGQVGVVPMLFYHLRFNNEKTMLLSCGPEIMMRFVVFEGLARRISSERIYLSLERNMKCGQGFCGHCQMGPFFVCKDGPVFRFDQLEPYFNLEDL
jgi:NAD(P)H-flavin reductase